MKGSVCHELDTDLPVDELWAVYGTLRLVQLAAELLPNIVQKVSTVHGDGEVGTVIQVNFVPGIPGPPYQKEEFVKVDNENRVKEAKVIEAGFLLFGFQSYLMRFEIVKKDNDSSVIRSTVEYEIDDEHASNASLVTTDLVATIAQVIAKYLKDQKSSPPSS
ncbi:S-norcoclaurine synthase-like [Ananas comosus]|uniref:S-norcoclaurine synthase-like n=1 Tax=Ananas comosus TaxID=4615 RepID=A0A6P5EPA8_ANACO|nr:S-norcoclaurine synthase-like [Ananas comosus]